MKVYLMRHGAAEPHAQSDAARKLTEQGMVDVESVAAQFVEKQPKISRLISSPYDRAQQTAKVLQKNLNWDVVETNPTITPEGDPATVLDFIEECNQDSIMLISHNPLLSNLLSLMLYGSMDRLQIVVPGQLFCVSFDIIAPGLGELEYTIRN